jgi:predicted DsbA family dithiol-disulfide isomerase
MQIHIVADMVCPWCYIGKRQFEQALAKRPDLAPTVRWLPFQLNPDLPPEGMDRVEYLAGRFGAEAVRQMDQQMTELAKSLGLEVHFDKIKKVPNTLAAHTLSRWADVEGLQQQVVEALFEANFVKGEDIGDIDVLCKIAQEVGMDPKVVRERLEQGVDRDAVNQEDQMIRGMGVQGVPCTIIDRKFVLSGAQGAEVFGQALDRAHKEESEASVH